MRRLATFCFAAAIAMAACGGSGAPTAPGGSGGGKTPAPGGSTSAPSGGGGDCTYWCGHGTASVTMGGSTVQISGSGIGGCFDSGTGVVDARFGDYHSGATNNYVMILVYRDGGTEPTVTGAVGGKVFVLGSDETATIGSDSKGTFSGSNSIGTGTVSGTFSCQ